MKNKLEREKVLLILLYVLPLGVALNNSLGGIIGCIIVGIFLFLSVFSDAFMCAFPFVILYSTKIYVFGTSLSTIYCFLLILHLIIKNKKKIPIKSSMLIPGFVVLLFSFFSLMTTGNRAFIMLLISNFGVLLYVLFQLRSEDNTRKFYNWFLFAMIGATIYGFLTMNQVKGGMNTANGWVYYNRFRGTFEDMNYWGFFTNVAIGVCLLSKSIERKKRIITLIILYASLLATASMTAYLCQFFILFIVLILNKTSYKAILGYCIFGITIIILFYFASKYSLGIITDAYIRITSKISQSNNVEDFTTGRSDLWSIYFNYFLSQNIFKLLLGFNTCVPAYNSTGIKWVPHQEHITWLINIGIVGTMIMEYYSIKKLVNRIRLVKDEKTNTEINCCLLITTATWFFYSFGLTMFSDYRFFTFFLV